MNLSLQIIISRNGDAGNMAGIMSVAILSLFLVFFFVAVLHCYARWCVAEGGRGRAPPVLVVPPVVGSHRLLIFRHLLNMDARDGAPLAKGLDPHVLSSIPVFVHEGDCGLECVICLSLFESGEKGRRLAVCGHAFHVGCIDMWLRSHPTCPVCRAPAAYSSRTGNGVSADSASVDGQVETNEWNVGVMRVDETRVMSSNVLEIVVEVPGFEGGSGSDATRKSLSSSDHVV